jgi:acyl carrier protein
MRAPDDGRAEAEMKATREEIETYILKLLSELSRDWDYSTDVTSKTLLFSELGFESLDAVVLGTALQQHYGKQMPFAELFAEIGRRDFRDLSIAELTEFVKVHLSAESNAQTVSNQI